MSFLLNDNEMARLIGDGLRQLYESTTKEPVPPAFLELLGALK